MKIKNNVLTPNWITTLSTCEIFVFGSNLEGNHYGGAAKIAHEKFGAEWGVGDGPTGQCYAIPTMHGGLKDIKPYVDKFIDYAKQHPMNRFLLTRIGCGIAGFADNEMAKLFLDVQDIPNIAVPKEWLPTFVTFGKMRPIEEKMQMIFTEKVLKKLCQDHLYQIGAGVLCFNKGPRVRYVSEPEKFGYANFGNYFFYKNEFYVWTTDDKWAEAHNQKVVYHLFHDECTDRGYARKVIFAGVCTPFKDCLGEWIYTGDVIDIKTDPHRDSYKFALGTFDTDEETDYRFILDNHCLMMNELVHNHAKLRRIGTVFFKLLADEYPPKTIRERTIDFNGWYDSTEEHKLKVLMSRYTPNFEQEKWKYTTLKVLGVDFNWRH